MDATAVLLDHPESLRLARVPLAPPQGDGPKAVIDVAWSGISTGTEKLLWSGRMPAFPGMGYPLVPGYETVGRVAQSDDEGMLAPGSLVFVPGARCFEGVRALFGGAASRLVVEATRPIPIPEGLGRDGVLLALAATAHHVTASGDGTQPDLIIGHGILGRLLARIAIAKGAPAPVVHEINPARQDGADGYAVTDPGADDRRDYRLIVDASGAPDILDAMVGRLGRGGEMVLAGFYDQRLSFAFPPAFIKRARFRIAAEFTPDDTRAVLDLIAAGRLSLSGLVTHARPADQAEAAYRTAFEDADCLKMTLDWRRTP